MNRLIERLVTGIVMVVCIIFVLSFFFYLALEYYKDVNKVTLPTEYTLEQILLPDETICIIVKDPNGGRGKIGISCDFKPDEEVGY